MSHKVEEKLITKVVSAVPKKRQDLVNWNGWGYKDSKFYMKDDAIYFTGSRYPLAGDIPMKAVLEWIKLNFKVKSYKEGLKMPTIFPEPLLKQEFLDEIKKIKIDFSIDGEDRLIRSHGQTLQDIYALRTLSYSRIPDLVLWPVCHDEVVEIVKLANKLDVVLIPFGGGTSVSGSVSCPQNEPDRTIVALDTSQMNRMLWFDKENLVACFEAGIVGQDLDRVLASEGYLMGHEPDSNEFSTLGGWVATRASGMKKNVYGNIEDLVVRVKMVTSKGVLERNISAPRVSCGPDFNQIILGSEGTLGIVTEVLVKIRPLPPVKKYGSLVFPDIESGIMCLREIAKKRYQPASIRLMDNEQFSFGQALKMHGGFFSSIGESLKMFALTKIKGYDIKKLAVATLLFEGEREQVARHEKIIYEIAKKYSGLAGGAANGQRGYVLTYVIAYLRDLSFNFGIVGDSFETSVPWDKCEKLCSNVKAVVRIECQNRGIQNFMISCRVTQSYDAGVCVYFYFGFSDPEKKLSDPVHIYREIENKARDEILAGGGSVSHHHGIGTTNSQWYEQSISSVGVNLFKSAKRELDPKNIFATENFLMPEDGADLGQPTSKL